MTRLSAHPVISRTLLQKTVLADLSREAAARAAAEERIHMLQEAVKFHESRLADAMAHTERVQAVLDRRAAALRDMEQALAASRATEHDYHTRLAARDAELRLVLELGARTVLVSLTRLSMRPMLSVCSESLPHCKSLQQRMRRDSPRRELRRHMRHCAAISRRANCVNV